MRFLPPCAPALFGLCLTATSVVALPGLAIAQPVLAPEAEADYRQLVERAFKAYADEDWAAAEAAFTQAHRFRPSAATLRALGMVAFNQDDFVSAVVQLRAALEDPHKALSDEQRAEAQALIEKCYPQVGRYRLNVSPAGSVVEIDGVLAASLSPEHVLAKGQHEFHISAPGYDEHVLPLYTAGGEDEVIEIELRARTKAQPKAPSDTPSTTVPLAPAPSQTPTSSVPPSDSTPAVFASADETNTGSPTWLKWVFFGAAAAGTVGAGAFWYLGENEFSDLESQCGGMCDEGDVDLSTLERWDLMTNVSLGVAGAGVVAGLLSLVLEGDDVVADDDTMLVVRPNGVGIGGRF